MAARKTQLIAVGNQKGGVGKTTNTLHIAAALGEMGYSSLIIDLDGNRGATKALGAVDDSDDDEPLLEWSGTLEVMLGTEKLMEVVLRTGDAGLKETDPPIDLPRGVELLAGSRSIGKFEVQFRSQRRLGNPLTVLQKPLEEIDGEYDYIFLDTAPNTAAPTMNAYMLCDWFILSTEPSAMAFTGVTDALRDITTAQDEGSPIRLLGTVICSVVKRTKIGRQYAEQASSIGGFETIIHQTTAIEGAQKLGKTLFQTEPKHAVAEEFRDLAKEIIERIAAERGQDDEAQAQ